MIEINCWSNDIISFIIDTSFFELTLAALGGGLSPAKLFNNLYYVYNLISIIKD
jgi:hypothetical protein